MTRPYKPPKHILDSASRGATKSPLYTYLDGLFDELVRTRRVNWDDLTADAAAAGIRDGRGHAPTTTRASKTWYEIRKRRAGITAGTAAPSPARPEPALKREPGKNQPIPLAPSPMTIPSGPAEAPTADSPEARGQAQIDRVLAELKARSDRRNGIF
jgi:hypothetical protein